MRRRTHGVVLVVLVLALLLPTSGVLGKREPELPVELTGDINGAAFIIRVPENWNGTLLLFGRGYSPAPVTSPTATLPVGGTEELLLENGYALAASGFRNAGWNIEEAIQDTQQLLVYFRRTVAHPKRVLVYGMSMGGLVALKSMEMYHGHYDGAVPICAPAMGSTRNADLKLDYTVAYAATFGWDPSWGDIGDLPDGEAGFTVYQQVMGHFWGNFSRLDDPAVFARFEFMRLVNDMPLGGFYQQITPMPGPGAALNMLLGYYLRYELEARAGGPAAQNTDHVYSLSDDDRAALRKAGMADEEMEELLAKMNAMANIEAKRSARQYLARFDFSGLIKAPVLMLHNIEDPLAIVESTQAYYETVAARGREDLLVRVYTGRPGHCNVTPEQVLALFQAMDSWLDTGVAPGAEALPADLDFDLDFEPDPWPQPPPN